MNVHRHPGVESALTLEDVLPGQAYVTYIPNQKVIERGVFTTEPGYSEDKRWTADARVLNGVHEMIERTVSLHGAGITPDYNGQGWVDAVTVADSE